MTPADTLALAERLENHRVILKSGDYDGADLMRAWCAMSDAAAALRESVAWRTDIEVAKTGVDVLAFVPGFGMGQMVLFWMDGYWREKANCMGLKVAPTHWMPLPAEPVLPTPAVEVKPLPHSTTPHGSNPARTA